MSTVSNRPLKFAAVCFLLLMGMFIAFALAGRFGLMDGASVQRMIGVLVGVLVVTIGNVLPKLRPVSASQVNVPGAPQVERVAGWVLVCAGVMQIALFLFAPPGVARTVVPIVEIGALVLIAARWTWRSRPEREEAGMSDVAEPTDAGATGRRNLKIWLFTAFFYVLLTSIASALFQDQPWARPLGSAMVIGFSVACAVLFVLLEHKRPRQ